MGVCTKGYIDCDINELLIKDVLKKIKCKNIKIQKTSYDYYYIIFFDYKKQPISLHLFLKSENFKETEIHLNFCEYSIEIMTKVLEYFSGYLVESDCDYDKVKIYRKYNLTEEDLKRFDFLKRTNLDEELSNKIYDFVLSNKELIKELIVDRIDNEDIECEEDLIENSLFDDSYCTNNNIFT